MNVAGDFVNPRKIIQEYRFRILRLLKLNPSGKSFIGWLFEFEKTMIENQMVEWMQFEPNRSNGLTSFSVRSTEACQF